MAQLRRDFFEWKFKTGDYSPLICLMLYEKSQKGKFSYEEIFHDIEGKFLELNTEMPVRAVTQLRECIDKFVFDGYLNEYAGMYYPTGKKKSVKQKVVVE